MRKRTKMSAKTPEEREISVSQAHKTDLTQPQNAAVNGIMPLQTSIGNRAVQRLFQAGIIQPRLRGGQVPRANRVLPMLDLRQVGLDKRKRKTQSRTQLPTSQTTSVIQPQGKDTLEARKKRGQRLAKDIIWAITLIREEYLKKYPSMDPMDMVLLSTIKRRKGPWDQYLTIDDAKRNYGKRDVRFVSYMEKTLVNTTRHGLVHGWTFAKIAESWHKIWSEGVQGVAYINKGYQQYDTAYGPMVKWLYGRRYKNSVLSYMVTPEPGFFKGMYRWLTSSS